jgi:hypothetical protein
MKTSKVGNQSYRPMGKVLARYRRQLRDPWFAKYYNVIESTVPCPTEEHPTVCILVAFRNAKGDTLFRTDSIEKWQRITWAPPEVILRFKTAMDKAEDVIVEIRKRVDLVWAIEHLPSATQIIRSDTGEVIYVVKEEGAGYSLAGVD